jgi:hypothetical protein
MSTGLTTKESDRPRAALKPARVRHTPGGAKLGSEAGPEAKRLAAAILEVLAGLRTPSQAAEVLAISLPRYFQIETRALQALVAACAPKPRGRGRSAEKEVAALAREQERLKRELSRQQTLLRLAQRTIGLAPPKPPAAASAKARGKKRRRKPAVRALRAAQALQRAEPDEGKPDPVAEIGVVVEQ